MVRLACRAAVPAVLAMFIAAVGAGGAAAAVRYAGPGGTGANPCSNPGAPCSIYTAASTTAPGTTVQSGDEVLLAPGDYSDSAGDLGPNEFVQLKEGIKVHGPAGQPRPVITLNHNTALVGAFYVEANDVLSHVEIDTAASRSNVEVFGGVMEDVIARSSSTVALTTVCVHVAGVIRNSACLATGANATAIGEANATAATSTATLRNVTAVSSGAGGKGLSYTIFNGGTTTVSAKAVIAKGSVTDVAATGTSTTHNPGTGGHVTINLDHSDFSTTEATQDNPSGGTATVTSSAVNSNVSALPLLAADGYHQLASSPTIDKGASDGSTGSADIDGQLRKIGSEVDIGADEMADTTSTTISCAPATLTLGAGATACTASVVDTSAGVLTPTGTVVFSAGVGGAFAAPGNCTLATASPGKAGCQLAYTPQLIGSGAHLLGAAYAGDTSHDGSQATTSVAVTAPAVGGGAGSGNVTPSPLAPATTLNKAPAKKSARRMAKFTFSSDQAGSTFECKLDKKPFKPCSSPFKKPVKPGGHNFKVRAVNSAGAADPTPATFHWKVLAG